jgi:hypothetical protein
MRSGRVAGPSDREGRSLVEERVHAARRRVCVLLRAGTAGVGCGPPIVLPLLATCLVASNNDVRNEVLDDPRDAMHPLKRLRPVPSPRANAAGRDGMAAPRRVGCGALAPAQSSVDGADRRAVDHGHRPQRSADFGESVAVRRCTQRIVEQPHSTASQLFRNREQPRPSDVAPSVALDGRCILSREATCGVPPPRHCDTVAPDYESGPCDGVEGVRLSFHRGDGGAVGAGAYDPAAGARLARKILAISGMAPITTSSSTRR